MYYTYVLLCTDLKNNRQHFYTGSTAGLKERLKRHKKGDINTTNKFDKTELVYYEACLNKTDARKREL